MICYKCGKEKALIMAVKIGCGSICTDCWYTDDDMCRRNVDGLVRWLHRRRDALRGRVFHDPRNQDQQDLGVELVWRSRVTQRIAQQRNDGDE